MLDLLASCNFRKYFGRSLKVRCGSRSPTLLGALFLSILRYVICRGACAGDIHEATARLVHASSRLASA